MAFRYTEFTECEDCGGTGQMLGHDSTGMETQVDCHSCKGYGGWEDEVNYDYEDTVDWEDVPEPITSPNLGVF